jgi:hypothetical protein
LKFAAQLIAAAAVVIAFVAPAGAAGALAVGKCGAYGHAFDYKDARAAMSAAQQQCRGDCKTIPMKRACAAFSIDMANPCGAHGFAVRGASRRPRTTPCATATNSATSSA